MGFLIWLVTAPVNILFRAFVLTKIWSWYIVTGFALEPLGMYHAFGLSLVVGFLTAHAPEFDKDRDETFHAVYLAAYTAILSVIVLTMGSIGTLFA